ncbi:unnamed protein product [Lactuca virosa]|uniref:Uncharacterized protein n=1 Tax=Lactuca virosa TaxID=75947 RepID=A0AAU9PBY8_9ASTR|nr:unnamed protein product [Lactuca virosa]
MSDSRAPARGVSRSTISDLLHLLPPPQRYSSTSVVLNTIEIEGGLTSVMLNTIINQNYKNPKPTLDLSSPLAITSRWRRSRFKAFMLDEREAVHVGLSMVLFLKKANDRQLALQRHKRE